MSTKKMVRCAMVAAIYVVICLALSFLSFGGVQVRISEALCLLPVFGAEYIVSVTLGCLLANLVGFWLGLTVVWDILFGTLATLLACLATYTLRHWRTKGLALPASLPPVISNAVIVGAEIAFFFPTGDASFAALYTFNALTVGLGEAISCCILGVALVKCIEMNPQLNRLFAA